MASRYAQTVESREHLRETATVTATLTTARGVVQRGSFGAALLVALGLSGWLFMLYLEATLVFLTFGGRAGLLDGSVALQCGVFGYFSVALLLRLTRGLYAWPSPRMIVAETLMGYGRGWGVGVTILTARQIAQAIQGVMVPPVSTILDGVFFVSVTLMFALPGVIAFALGAILRR